MKNEQIISLKVTVNINVLQAAACHQYRDPKPLVKVQEKKQKKVSLHT